MVEISRQRSSRRFFFLGSPPWPLLLLSSSPFAPALACSLFARHDKAQTNLGHGVAAVLGVAGTLLVRRLDDEADGTRGGDDRSDAGAVEAGASGPGRRRGQARRPDEGGGEHGKLGCCEKLSASRASSRRDEGRKEIYDSIFVVL